MKDYQKRTVYSAAIIIALVVVVLLSSTGLLGGHLKSVSLGFGFSFDSTRLPSCGPHIIGIGAQKGGTTALHHYVRWALTDQIQLGKGKEVHFFDDAYSEFVTAEGRSDAYLELFNITKSLRKGHEKASVEPCMSAAGVRYRPAGKTLAMEVTPSYLYQLLVPERVKQIVPNARFIALLRNPVSRTISQIVMDWNNGRYSELGETDIVEVLRQIVERSKNEINACSDRYPDISLERAIMTCFHGDMSHTYSEFSQKYVDVLWRGMYVYHLRVWMSVFPLDRFLLWSSEQFANHTEQHIRELAKWVNIDSSALQFDRIVEHDVHTGTYPDDFQVPEDVMLELNKFFAPHNAELFKFLKSRGYKNFAKLLQKYFWN